jgi:hypothetical protein
MRAFVLFIIFGLPGWVQAQERSPYVPNPKLTPSIALNANKDDLCGSGSKTIDGRLPISLRRRVFDLYGIRAGEPTSYNVDARINRRGERLNRFLGRRRIQVNIDIRRRLYLCVTEIRSPQS